MDESQNNKRSNESSLKSAEPLCEYYGDCGGCDLQHVAYKDQLILKMNDLKMTFHSLAPGKIREIIASSKEYFYRNRITLHHDGKTYGYYQASSHKIVAIEKCVIASEAVNSKLKNLGVDVLSGPDSFEIREDDHASFLQVNAYQNQNLIDVVLEFCGGQKSQTVLELYCGSGNLSFPLSKISKSIFAIDGDENAIQAAETRRIQEKNKKIQFKTSAVYDVCFELSQNFERFTTVVCDPPREGLRDVAKILPRFKASKIVYVSCNPSSFKRDAKIFIDKGYRLEEIVPIDMFPQTKHVEVVGLFICT